MVLPCGEFLVFWQEKDKQQKSYRSLLGERDKLGAQLVKQNGEIAVLQEQIRLQTSAIQVSQMQLLLPQRRVISLQFCSSSIFYLAICRHSSEHNLLSVKFLSATSMISQEALSASHQPKYPSKTLSAQPHAMQS